MQVSVFKSGAVPEMEPLVVLPFTEGGGRCSCDAGIGNMLPKSRCFSWAMEMDPEWCAPPPAPVSKRDIFPGWRRRRAGAGLPTAWARGREPETGVGRWRVGAGVGARRPPGRRGG